MTYDETVQLLGQASFGGMSFCSFALAILWFIGAYKEKSSYYFRAALIALAVSLITGALTLVV